MPGTALVTVAGPACAPVVQPAGDPSTAVRDSANGPSRSAISESRMSRAASSLSIEDVADGHGLDTGALRAIRAAIERTIADGHGGDGLARLSLALGR